MDPESKLILTERHTHKQTQLQLFRVVGSLLIKITQIHRKGKTWRALLIIRRGGVSSFLQPLPHLPLLLSSHASRGMHIHLIQLQLLLQFLPLSCAFVHSPGPSLPCASHTGFTTEKYTMRDRQIWILCIRICRIDCVHLWFVDNCDDFPYPK